MRKLQILGSRMSLFLPLLTALLFFGATDIATAASGLRLPSEALDHRSEQASQEGLEPSSLSRAEDVATAASVLRLPSEALDHRSKQPSQEGLDPSSLSLSLGGRHLCHVSDFGASGNGKDFDTAAIQAAIDACAPRNGVVYLPPGRYRTATIFLRSNITLQIDQGATVLGSPYQRDYPKDSSRWYVILAENAENVEVTGGGTIDGQGLKFVTKFDDRKNVMVSWNTTGDCLGDECRPRLIGFLNCKRVHVWNVYLHEPAYWCLHIVQSNAVLIENVRIYGDFNIPNNDGIDIESTNNTLIRDCHIDTGDDAICPKTFDGPLFNLTVTDCWIRTKSSAVKLGSASYFDFQGLHFERLKIVESHRGLALQLRDTGKISNVTFANIEMSTRYYDPSWWGRAEPIYVTACPRSGSTIVGSITDVYFVNISSTSENGIFLAGSEGSTLANIRFQNVSVDFTNSNTTDTYHDYRPGCQGLVAHPSSGLFIDHASDISFTDVNFKWAPNIVWNLPFDFAPRTVEKLKLVEFSSSPDGQAAAVNLAIYSWFPLWRGF